MDSNQTTDDNQGNEQPITDVLELLDAAETLVTKVVALGRDGYQASDALQLVLDNEVRQQLEAAADNINEAGVQLKDLSLDEADILTERTRALGFSIARTVTA